MTVANDLALASLIEPVARALFGEPNRAMSSRTELRFGNNGSLSVDLVKGTWYDFETEQGGGVLDLIRRDTGLQTAREQLQWMEDRGIKEARANTRPNGNSRANSNGVNGEYQKKVVETYQYPDRDGELRMETLRCHLYQDGKLVVDENGKPRKTFLQRRPDPRKLGGYDWSVKGIQPIIYRWPEVANAVANGRMVVVAEGEGKANLLWGWNIPATCSPMGAGKWGKLGADHIREVFTGVDVVICPDNDEPGRKHRNDIATSLQGIARRVRILELPDLPPKGDVVDFANSGGTAEQFLRLVETVATDWVEDAPKTAPEDDEPSNSDDSTRGSAEGATGNKGESDGQQDNSGTQRKRPKFKLTWLKDITASDDISYLIDGLLPATGLAIIFGPPKSLKSFMLTDALLHVAIGKQYCDRDVQSGAVVYVTSEGVAGIKRRLIAMRRYHEVEGEDIAFALVPTMPDLGNGVVDVVLLKAEIENAIAGLGVPVRAIVIDTMRRAIPGKSENDQKDVSVFVANCEALASYFNCLVAVVHHSPRSDSTRGSGSNALDAAADCMWSVVRPDQALRVGTVSVAAMKDGDGEGDTWGFQLIPDEIGTDRNGGPMMSGHVEITQLPDRRPVQAKTQDPWRAKSLKLLRQAMINMLATMGSNQKPFPDGPEVRAVDIEVVRTEFYNSYPAAGDAKDKTSARRKAFARALADAQAKELIGSRDIGSVTFVWFASSTENA